MYTFKKNFISFQLDLSFRSTSLPFPSTQPDNRWHNTIITIIYYYGLDIKRAHNSYSPFEKNFAICRFRNFILLLLFNDQSVSVFWLSTAPFVRYLKHYFSRDTGFDKQRPNKVYHGPRLYFYRP